jgi:cellulose synthase/poly-beta-1,6-N-acetylglucosamine synthase-like glycosyltransferase
MPLATVIVLGNAALLSLAWIAFFLQMLAAMRQARPLAQVLAESEAGSGTGDDGPLPPLTVVVTARDEAGGIEATVRALLAQEYPGLQVVVVDDRSTDGTGELLDRIVAEGAAPERLEVVHNLLRPDGWLGKCWACRRGAALAKGEWILFKDGDVTLVGKDTLARIIRFARRSGLDHVAVIPDMGPMPVMQAAVVAAFGQMFLLLTRAHEMDRDLRRGGGGVGAFNLVRRAPYEAIGGHERLRMDPGDDVKLGQLLKGAGARQRIFVGTGLVRCPWQRGALGVVRGLEKNGFSGFNYSLARLALFTALGGWFVYGPLLSGFFGPLVAGGGAGIAAAAWIPAAILAALAVGSWALDLFNYPLPLASVLLYPVAVAILFGAMWNSAIRTLARGGIEWRGDFYPLAELKGGLVRAGAVPRRDRE